MADVKAGGECREGKVRKSEDWRELNTWNVSECTYIIYNNKIIIPAVTYRLANQTNADLYGIYNTSNNEKKVSGILPSLPQYPPSPLSQSLTFKEEKISNNKFYADFQEMQWEAIYT